MKITGVIVTLIAVWSLAARCNSDALVENPKTVSPETIAADGENGASASADSPATVDKNPAVVATPEPASTDSNNTVDEADFDPDDPEDAAIAAEVREIMRHGRETYRQEMHDYGPKAVPYLLYLFEKQIENHSDLSHTAMCLGAVGDERATEPMIAEIENVMKSGGSLSHLLQALGYLAAQGSDRAYQYLIDMVQPRNWEKNSKHGYLEAALYPLAKSNREDAHIALKQLFEPLQRKAALGQPLTPIEQSLLSFARPENMAEIIREVKLTGIFGYYNGKIRAQKGIVDGPPSLEVKK